MRTLVSHGQCTRTNTHVHTHTDTHPDTCRSSAPLQALRSPKHHKLSMAKSPMFSGHKDTTARLRTSHGQFWGRPMPLAVCVTHTCHSGGKVKLSHLFPSALHDFNRNGIDLIVHLHRSLFPTTDFHQQDTEICSSKIQGQEVTMLCCSQEHKEYQKHLSASWQPGTPRLQTFKGETPMLNNGEKL